MTFQGEIADLRARVERLEQGHQEHAADLDDVRARLGALQSGVDRLYTASTRQGLTLERVHTLLEQLVRQQTPTVVVAGGGRHG